jgi:hypothetical protein
LSTKVERSQIAWRRIKVAELDSQCHSQQGIAMILQFRKTEGKRVKIHDLSLSKECYSMKQDLLTNATVVGEAMKFISEYTDI